MAYSGLATIDARTGVGGHYSPASYRKGYQYIILHHNGSTNFDAVPAVWETRPASAHYQVGPNAIKVCLDEELVAWSAGNWDANTKAIAIENVDMNTNWEIAPETMENCAKLVADIAKRRGIPIDADHVKPHRAFKATSCPGRLDVDWVINRARELSGQQAIAPVTPSNPQVVPKPQQADNRIYFDYRGRVREQPTTDSRTMRVYDAGTKMDYAGWVHGQNINGSDKWLKTALHGWYVHESVTGGVFGLKELGTVNVSAPASNTPQTGSNGLVAQNGTYKAYFNMKIRTAPSLSAQSIDTFDKGASHSYDGYVDNEGIRWISFIGDTTKKRVYVARRKLDNSEIWGECY